MFQREIKPYHKKVYLSSPTMHGEEILFIQDAYQKNWMSTVGENIDEVEKQLSNKIGMKYGVGLSCGTSALHLAMKLAGIKRGDYVFCSDMTFSATVNPVVYEGGIPIFIDSEYETWNMDPKSLEKAFSLYPNVKVVVMAHLYGTPAKVDEILEICKKHNTILIEDAAESLGSTYKGQQTGSFGTYNVISFNGNKIITGSCGGMLLTNDENAAKLARKWSTQSREPAPWYQHTDLGYNYRLSNVVAGVIRGQIPHLDEHIKQKTEIFERYKKGLKDLPVSVNPNESYSISNHWLSCLLINSEAMSEQKRTDLSVSYKKEHGKTCPSEILEILTKHNFEGRPIWKPMHMQPIFKNNIFVSANKYPVNEDIFERGLCLPSDNKMTKNEQERIIELIKECFE